jgi:hypothetical protein
MFNYQKKYLKYKSKYLNKRLIGGIETMYIFEIYNPLTGELIATLELTGDSSINSLLLDIQEQIGKDDTNIIVDILFNSEILNSSDEKISTKFDNKSGPIKLQLLKILIPNLLETPDEIDKYVKYVNEYTGNNIKIFDKLLEIIIKSEKARIILPLIKNKAFLIFYINKYKFVSNILAYINSVFIDDIDVVLAAVNRTGVSLRHASVNMKNNINVVKKAVENSGTSLEFASENLKDNLEVVLAAVNQTGDALEYASNNMKNNKTVALAVINKSIHGVEYIGEEIKRDKEVSSAFLKKYHYNIVYI